MARIISRYRADRNSICTINSRQKTKTFIEEGLRLQGQSLTIGGGLPWKDDVVGAEYILINFFMSKQNLMNHSKT
jgi:hypothetical protein